MVALLEDLNQVPGHWCCHYSSRGHCPFLTSDGICTYMAYKHTHSHIQIHTLSHTNTLSHHKHAHKHAHTLTHTQTHLLSHTTNRHTLSHTHNHAHCHTQDPGPTATRHPPGQVGSGEATQAPTRAQQSVDSHRPSGLFSYQYGERESGGIERNRMGQATILVCRVKTKLVLLPNHLVLVTRQSCHSGADKRPSEKTCFYLRPVPPGCTYQLVTH